MNPNGGAPFPATRFPCRMLSPVAVALTKYLPVSSANQCGKVTFGIPATGD